MADILYKIKNAKIDFWISKIFEFLVCISNCNTIYKYISDIIFQYTISFFHYLMYKNNTPAEDNFEYDFDIEFFSDSVSY